MSKLQGKVAVVTGGSRDIGRAIAIKLAKEGAKVVVNYFNSEEEGNETVRLIKENGGEAIAAYRRCDESGGYKQSGSTNKSCLRRKNRHFSKQLWGAICT